MKLSFQTRGYDVRRPAATQGQVFTLAVSLPARERGVLGSSFYP